MNLRKPIVHDSLQERVFDALRTAILNGGLTPGEQLSLKDIAKDLNVSTMPVREALRRLEAQGMVTFFGQKKIIVTELSSEDLEEFYWIRIPLECRAFARNFPSIENTEIEELVSLNEKMGLIESSASEWVGFNRKFHMTLYGISKSAVLKGALSWLWDNVTPYLNIYAQNHSRVETACEMHDKIIQAIRESRQEIAVEYLKEHLRSGYLVKGSLKKPA